LQNVRYLKLREQTDWNYSYFPVIFKSENDLLKVLRALNNEGIFPRRYFYPSLDTLPYVDNQNCEISRDIAQRVLCLPLYYALEEHKVLNICNLINEHL
ncbi:MAG: DegT/DnrJ/EryC1/StrS family aminotransferase, partial [Flavobacteriaceae bacterium]|nr:DegT/DnrJ/EryC1/StrS family aminotransferase [Flavobacteriaceae bacterium]